MLKLLVKNVSNLTSLNSLKKILEHFGKINWIKKKKTKILENTYLVSFYNEYKKNLGERKIFSIIIDGKEVKIKKIKNENVEKMTLKKKKLKKIVHHNLNKIPTSFPEGSLEVVNFHQSITEKEVLSLFGYFGYIIDFQIKKDTRFHNNSKKVMVRYGIPECAIKAACFIEKKIYKGIILRIYKINTINTIKKEYSPIKHTVFDTFKKLQNDNDRKKIQLYNSWISLFVGNETIQNVFEEKYGNKKSENSKIDQSVYSKGHLMITQGRSHAESKLSLKKEGVLFDLYPFSNQFKKSRKSFFVKYKTESIDFSCLDTLKKFGKVKTFFFFFKSNTIIISYKRNSDAEIAFKHLRQKSTGEGYKLIDWVPLNFEKKRESLLRSVKTNSEKNNKNQKKAIHSKVASKIPVTLEKFYSKNKFYKPEYVYKQDVIKQFNYHLEKKFSTSHGFFRGKLIVRNIPFKIQINDLKKIFSIFGKIISIRLPKRKNGENRGFAFIDYGNLYNAKKALYFVQNTKIDSRFLKINLIE
jgi:hypothetical protein